MIKILGISASLRNASTAESAISLCEQIKKFESIGSLLDFLKDTPLFKVESPGDLEKKLSLSDDFSLTDIQCLRRKKGLSNSEAALVTALWGACINGADIDLLPLAEHFLPNNKIVNEQKLREKIFCSNALLVSGPVYFGDRGSLAQSFLEYCASDMKIRSFLKGKVYAGIAVGAKRNGGQETTLIYQLLDMINMSMLAVGNNSESTAQYGGTGVAGDVGTFVDDDYGINTCVGTGKRVAQVAELISRGSSVRISGKPRIHMWLLQDSNDGKGLDYFESMRQKMQDLRPNNTISLWNLPVEKIHRCLACDVCPSDLGNRQDYRCTIRTKNDFFSQYHSRLVDVDAIMLCAYSPEDRGQVNSVYQQFIERTRYIRRDNYLFSNILVTPFVLSELSARQNLHIRMLTSIIRHHTVLYHPIIGMIFNNKLLNEDNVIENGLGFIDQARILIAGQVMSPEQAQVTYQPVGYQISKEKMDHDRHSGRLSATLKESKTTIWHQRQKRLQII